MNSNIGLLNLLDIAKNKNLLKEVPLEVRTVIVNAGVRYFLQNYETVIQTCLPTIDHLKWWFEVFAQSFQFPKRQSEVMFMTIKIYEKLLFNKDENRPTVFLENKQYFTREIFAHFTFLFTLAQEKEILSKEVEKDFIVISNQVLGIWLRVGEEKLIDVDSSIYLMKLLLGITDVVCRKEEKLPGIQNLGPIITKTLFEFWICSTLTNLKLWAQFQEISKKWINNDAFVDQWGAITKALSLRIIQLLYGESVGTSCVKIEWKGLNKIHNPNLDIGHYVTELEISPEFTYFLFHIFLYATGNPNEIKNPTTFRNAMNGIKDVSLIFARLDKRCDYNKLKEPGITLKYPPNTQTILKYTGDWLFEACNREKKYVQGKALAHETLCKVLCRKGVAKLDTITLSLFYEHIMKGLKDDEIEIKSAIFLHAQKVFTLDLEGSFIMIPTFMSSCEAFLTGKSAAQHPAYIRLACIKIIASLLCVSNQYEHTVKKSLKLQIQRNLVKVLNSEKNEKNLQHILWTICVCVFEEVDQSKKIGSMFSHQLLQICKSYGTKPNKQYTPNVFCTIYEVLTSFVPIWKKIYLNDPSFVSDIVSLLSDQIEGQIKLLIANPGVYYKLILKAFNCISQFVVYAFPIILKNEALVSKILIAVEFGLSVDPESGKELDSVYRAALFLLKTITVIAGNYPALDSKSVFYSLVEDDALLQDKKKGKNTVTSNNIRHYLIFNKFLLSLIEQPAQSIGNKKIDAGVSLVVRNSLGKFNYDCKNMLTEKEKPTVKLLKKGAFKGSSSVGLIGYSKEDKENEILMKYFQKDDKKDDKKKWRPKIKKTSAEIKNKNIEKAISLIDQFEDILETYRNEQLKTIDVTDFSVSEEEVPKPYHTENKFQLSRLLLSHLGLFHIGPDKFFQVVQSPELLTLKNELDAIYPRECSQISIIYLKNGDDKPENYFKNKIGSKRFKEFVGGLGWSTPITNNPKDNYRFLGGLKKDECINSKQPYSSSFTNETIFHVFLRLKGISTKLKYLNKNRVNIIWNENNREFNPVLISTENMQINIVVQPKKYGMYRIRIYKSKSLPVFGPLVDGMLISSHCLVELVHHTAINAEIVMKHVDPKYITPTKERSLKITKISKKLKRGLTLDNLLATVFIPFKQQASQVSISPRIKLTTPLKSKSRLSKTMRPVHARRPSGTKIKIITPKQL